MGGLLQTKSQNWFSAMWTATSNFLNGSFIMYCSQSQLTDEGYLTPFYCTPKKSNHWHVLAFLFPQNGWLAVGLMVPMISAWTVRPPPFFQATAARAREEAAAEPWNIRSKGQLVVKEAEEAAPSRT